MRVALAIALLALGASPATGAKGYGVSVQPNGKAKVTNSYANMFGYKATKHNSKGKVRRNFHTRRRRLCLRPKRIGTRPILPCG